MKTTKSLFSKLLLSFIFFVGSNLELKTISACNTNPCKHCCGGLQGDNDSSMKFDKVKIKIYKDNERSQRRHMHERERIHRHNRRHDRRRHHRHGRRHHVRRHFF